MAAQFLPFRRRDRGGFHVWGDGRGGLAFQIVGVMTEGLQPDEVRQLRDLCDDALKWAYDAGSSVTA